MRVSRHVFLGMGGLMTDTIGCSFDLCEGPTGGFHIHVHVAGHAKTRSGGQIEALLDGGELSLDLGEATVEQAQNLRQMLHDHVKGMFYSPYGAKGPRPPQPKMPKAI